MSEPTFFIMPTHPIQQNSSRIDFLDGLRALAALWVLLGHIHLFTYGWFSHSSLLTMPLNILLYLHLGVNVFLVLSGFCLALPIVKNKNFMRTSLSTYIKARALRILPPYYAALIMVLLINFFVPIIAAGRHPLGLTADIPLQVLWANALLMQDFFPQFNTINGPFWSIATEWHLYFLFPLMIWGLRKFGALALLLAGTLLATYLTWKNMNAPIILHTLGMVVPQPPYFVFLFSSGIVAAWFSFGMNSEQRMQRFKQTSWILIAVLLIPMTLILWKYRISDSSNVQLFETHLYQIDPLFGVIVAISLCMLSSLQKKNRVRRCLENRYLVAIGGFSYSLYLIHIPILAAANYFLMPIWETKSAHFAFLLMVIVGGSFSLFLAKYFATVFETKRWLTIFTLSWRKRRPPFEANS